MTPGEAVSAACRIQDRAGQGSEYALWGQRGVSGGTEPLKKSIKELKGASSCPGSSWVSLVAPLGHPEGAPEFRPGLLAFCGTGSAIHA